MPDKNPTPTDLTKQERSASVPDWLPNWEKPNEYPNPDKTSKEQWAWEFLRRNPRYVRCCELAGCSRENPVATEEDLTPFQRGFYLARWPVNYLVHPCVRFQELPGSFFCDPCKLYWEPYDRDLSEARQEVEVLVDRKMHGVPERPRTATLARRHKPTKEEIGDKEISDTEIRDHLKTLAERLEDAESEKKNPSLLSRIRELLQEPDLGGRTQG